MSKAEKEKDLLQIEQRLVLPNACPKDVATVAPEAPDALNRQIECLKARSIHRGLCGGCLFGVALAEEGQCQVQILRQAEIAARRMSAQFVAEGE